MLCSLSLVELILSSYNDEPSLAIHVIFVLNGVRSSGVFGGLSSGSLICGVGLVALMSLRRQ